MAPPQSPSLMVGRERELATLSRFAGVTDGPRPGLALLSGDAGIGKSRLLSALAASATAQGWRVAVGHCLDFGGSPLPFLPFSELAVRLESVRPDRMAQLAKRWPELRRLLSQANNPNPQQVTETMDRGRFFGALHAVLTELAREAPLLVLIEDVHWADQSTCDLLSFLFGRGFTEPVSIVVSYRSDDLHRRHPLRTIAAGWSRLPGVTRVELGALPDQDVRRLIQALDTGTLTESEIQTIVDRCEGNAFFTEELVAAGGSRSLPPDLAGLLLLRLDQLDPDARAVVRAASAGGRLVREAVLLAVSDVEHSRFRSAIRTAVELNILIPDDDGYRFRHSILSEAVYDDLLPGERSRVHAAYVAALIAPGSQATSADLARHARAADDHATAYAASVRAGDEAAALGGPDEAARHYATALDLLDSTLLDARTLRPDDAVTLTEKAAWAAAAAGHVKRAEALVSTQLGRLPDDAAAEHRARLLIALVEAAALSDSTIGSINMVTTAAEALALVPAEPPTLLRARAVATYAMVLGNARRDDEAVRWAEEGLGMPAGVRAGEVTTLLQAVLARVFERSGDTVGSSRILHELAELTSNGSDPSEVRVLFQLAGVLFEQGELAEALEMYRRSARRSIELGRPYAPYGVDSRVLAGVVAYQLGQWDLASEIVDLGAEDAPELAAAGLLSVTLTIRAGRGEVAGWQTVLERVRSQWTTDGMIAVNSAAAAIDLAGDSGQIDAAVAVFDDAVASNQRNWGTADFQARIRMTSVLLGQLASHVAAVEPERRAELLARAEDLAEHAGHASAMGRRPERGLESQAWLLRLRAELLRLRSSAGGPADQESLVSAWQAAVDAFDCYGHVFEAARSRARLAAALQSAGETREATQVADAAFVTARQLGAEPLLAELRPLARGQHQVSPSVSVLTPREREVLALVAAGQTNGEIGRALFISTKTASVHVSNILGKLEAKTRTEAAAIAHRRGLLS